MKIIAIFMLLITVFPVMSADFSFSGEYNAIVMEGKIESGDVEKLLYGIAMNPERAASTVRIFVKSPGGNVNEALKIAKVINSMGYWVVVDEYCASACFFIYSGAHSRGLKNNSRLGIHSIYYSDERFAQLSASEAKKQFSETEQLVREFLLAHSVPTHMQDLLFSVSSRDIYWLSTSELKSIGTSLPHIRELTIARCGSEEDVSNKIDLLDKNSPDFQNSLLHILNAHHNCVFSVALSDRIAYIDMLLNVTNTKSVGWAKYKNSPFINESFGPGKP